MDGYDPLEYGNYPGNGGKSPGAASRFATRIKGAPRRWADKYSYPVFIAIGFVGLAVLVLFSLLAADKDILEEFGETLAIIGAILGGLVMLGAFIMAGYKYSLGSSERSQSASDSQYGSAFGSGVYDGDDVF